MQNKLYYGDNLAVLRNHIATESVDLCYIDPPFNSKRNYNQIYNNIGGEKINKAQTQAFIDTWTWDIAAEQGLNEIIENKNNALTIQSIKLIVGLTDILGKCDLLAYLISMTLRIAEIHRVLKLTGSFYLHCDSTASHYLKLICDGIFCPKGGDFRNEIVWCYRGAGYPKKDFGRRHDCIFRYAKSKNFVFNLDAVREEYAEATKERFAHYIGNKRGKNDFGLQTLNPLGKQPDDWWQIQPIAPSAKERLGYPTQKPEALLEKIIKASSNEGDIVLDAYCGCGTTVVVAQQLNRQWIGIDITYQSISLILKRLEHRFSRDFSKDYVDKDKAIVIERIKISGVPKDMASAIALANRPEDKTRKEFEKWMILTYSNHRAAIQNKKGKDGGIDGMAFVKDIVNGKEVTKKIIFQVKSNQTLEPSVLRDLNGTIDFEKAEIGILLTLYELPNIIKESKKYGIVKLSGMEFQKIWVVCVEEMLK
jgi:site-specific DNA-methyltransferase (adenine-specific)